jgi:exopolysaccharide biosynthesis protein
MVLSIAPGLVAGLPAVVAGMTLQVMTETFPKLEEVKVAIGGGPTLVRDGKAMQWNGLQARHPRSAVGFNRDTVFLVEIDGRQGNISLGMSFPELAAYMQKLGCENAMNLDGGGSATLWVFGNVINSPSEGRERPSANALVVVEKNRRTRRE